ncbi:RWD domain-containing protein 4-like [Tubulanus polymorphus]|uniref:RWD domain-containing protein 4-like n=1 Tax=Tubulanus polymorphus TaxID=672921 RepID=UPI003DA3BC5A
MNYQEEQQEELEVLRSIYEGDEAFKEIEQNKFQYKVGEDGDYKSLLVEIVWGESYPSELPEINLNLFYNKHINESIINEIVSKLLQEAELNIGCAMSYTLFEWVKENQQQLMQNQQENTTIIQDVVDDSLKENGTDIDSTKNKQKKEQLTKQQKRRLYNRLDNKGEMSRGWNWVDVVRHLSQTADT